MSGCRHCHGPHDINRHAINKRRHDAGIKCEMCDQADREEHLAWAKKRALSLLPNDPGEAVASMVSDLTKHPAWRDPISIALLMDGRNHSHSAVEARKWIEGWN